MTQVIDPTMPPYTDEEITPLKPAVQPEQLQHRHLREGEFWREIPAYKEVDEATFLDHIWQGKNSVTHPDKLLETIQDLAPTAFVDDVRDGFAKAPMSLRVSPYMIACIDWQDPYHDPIRTQFIPVGSRLSPDHPMLKLDSLHEQEDAPVPGLTHRYVDKALFLPLDTCPVYCRFCTRSYAVGLDTEQVEKVQLGVNPKRWAKAFKYIASRPELEDIVVSGGDTYQLAPRNIRQIGETLLKMDNIRRIRFATKGPAVMPMKILTHGDWTDALCEMAELARSMGKEVALHTHFNNPSEITWITQKAIQLLISRGVYIRNQSVLIRGVNDDPETMRLLVKRLGHIGVHPYYVYMHDMVAGVEDLRTRVQTALDIEKYVRGSTAGFNTPTFVCDAPGGGGKRDVHSFEYYDRDNGIAVYVAPSVKPGQMFMYFDPIKSLSPEAQARWQDPVTREEMMDEARRKAMDAAR
ncbi:MAG: KamA family radical SAM protein [Candidatus Sericytochromatia bacterium]|nr:KamA family radical SAM protein [Candidatus Sericytochromatia bacterium]